MWGFKHVVGRQTNTWSRDKDKKRSLSNWCWRENELFRCGGARCLPVHLVATWGDWRVSWRGGTVGEGGDLSAQADRSAERYNSVTSSTSNNQRGSFASKMAVVCPWLFWHTLWPDLTTKKLFTPDLRTYLHFTEIIYII